MQVADGVIPKDSILYDEHPAPQEDRIDIRAFEYLIGAPKNLQIFSL